MAHDQAKEIIRTYEIYVKMPGLFLWMSIILRLPWNLNLVARLFYSLEVDWCRLQTILDDSNLRTRHEYDMAVFRLMEEVLNTAGITFYSIGMTRYPSRFPAQAFPPVNIIDSLIRCLLNKKRINLCASLFT